jgi:hypothetical protein
MNILPDAFSEGLVAPRNCDHFLPDSVFATEAVRPEPDIHLTGIQSEVFYEVGIV